MACEGCTHPMHEQYQHYPGHWYCFHPMTCGKTICNTPKEEYNDFAAHNARLAAAKTPKWCPIACRVAANKTP